MTCAVVSDVDSPTPNLYYVYADHLNRPIKMTDETKADVWDAVYWPFGEAYSITGSASNNLRFSGQYFLLESGLAYNWHRHYDPTLGRYTQPDPLGFVDGPSLYAYAKSSPLGNVDPDGMQAVAPIVLGVTTLCTRYPPLCVWTVGAAVNACMTTYRVMTGGGGGRHNDDECHSRYNEEVQRCYEAKWQVAHRDYTAACVTRASIRRDLCIRNGGSPDPNEPPEWKPGPDLDEETWRNLNR